MPLSVLCVRKALKAECPCWGQRWGGGLEQGGHLGGWNPTWHFYQGYSASCCHPASRPAKTRAGPTSVQLHPLSLELHWHKDGVLLKLRWLTQVRISASNYLDLLSLLYHPGRTCLMDPDFKLGPETEVLLQDWDPGQGREETFTRGEREVILIWIQLAFRRPTVTSQIQRKTALLALSNVHFQDVAQLLIINPVAGWSVETDVPKAVLFSEIKRMKLWIRQIKKKFKYLHPDETRCWKNRHDKIAAIKCNLI